MLSKKKRRLRNEVNAGSMADIAFLLLIFFLVTTTIEIDKGITARLPPWDSDPPIPRTLNRDNVLTIKVNAQDLLLVEGELAQVETLKELTKEFIMNPNRDDNKPKKPSKAIISLQNDRGTSYAIYIEVYNEIKAAYNELWDAKSNTLYGVNDAELTIAQKKEIRKLIPLVISEAEPTDHVE